MRFGFTSFIKLACLKPRQQEAALRKRLLGSGGGYDFHKRMKRYCARRMAGEPLHLLLKEIAEITYERERNSIIHGLKQLELWLLTQPAGPSFALPTRVYESPGKLIRVDLAPEFGREIDGRRVGYHVWKTKKPSLDPDAREACLWMLSQKYQEHVAFEDCEFEVLSLLVPRAYSLRSPERAAAYLSSLMGRLERMITKISDEKRPPPPPPPGPHPPPP